MKAEKPTLFREKIRAETRDLSAEQQDQKRPSRLEQKKGLYLIKVMLDCLVMWFEHQNPNGEDEDLQGSILNIRKDFSVRLMEYILNLYNRDLPDINDPKTISNTTKYSNYAESTGQGDPIGAAKEVRTDGYHKPRPDSQTGEVKDEFWRLLELSKAINGAGEDPGLPMEIRMVQWGHRLIKVLALRESEERGRENKVGCGWLADGENLKLPMEGMDMAEDGWR
ncbi:hypothetical protein BY996DRAFT_6576003 [Phakopsora pachyrhizi]|nr:hypothetical protein BY996DRAFT_6576003 [Phakopsora pachyrhizi]